MISDTTNQFRTILENEPPSFFDRVNTPWDQVPDLEDYNRQAYLRIVRALKDLTRSSADQAGSNAQGVLVLGEAGTGKTHLLMRVARNLAETNHILFIRKPNNEEAVAQHIWANVVGSLARTIPTKTSLRSQLDDLLAHVFSKVLIPEFEQDIREDKDADQKRRWVARLQEDPYNLFNMLGEGEKRQDNLDRIRKRTLKYLQFTHPDVDQTIARVLITYCFVVREDRKRVLLTWLAGQDVEETEAKDLGLPPSWITLDETSGDASTQQHREEQALRAIRTVGILSTYYQPLILAFDQLEGLRDQPRLTHKWGDTVREIFTMAPNFLVITCIFPSLWETWFLPTLDQSVSERIAQQVVTLDTFGPQHGLKLLETHLEQSFIKHRLPTSIFPFATLDVQQLCQKATSPRSFIQAARHEFQSWLDGNPATPAGGPVLTSKTVSQAEIDEVIKTALGRFEESLRKSFASEMVLEQDFFGRIRTLTETLLFSSPNGSELAKATCRHFVMPPNVIVRHPGSKSSLCLAVMNSEGTSFAARMRNLNKCLNDGDQFTHLLMIRDRRCKRLGAKSQEHLEEAQSKGASYIQAGQDEMTCLNAVYDTLVAVEEHDLTVGDHEIDKRQVVGFLRNERVLSRTEFFRHAGRHCPPLAEVVGLEGPQSTPTTSTTVQPNQPQKVVKSPKSEWSDFLKTAPSNPPPSKNPLPSTVRGMVEIVVGDDVLDSPHVGMLGELRDGRKRLGISLTKPQCLVLLGYMGSGKSYALGVLIENALLTQPGLIEQSRPMCVVAFNYRRNPQSRFEHGGFAMPNSEPAEIKTLAQKYGAQPIAVETVNVFGYQEELPRRHAEYGSLRSLPIQFRPDELGAEHWEILMKPPTREAEYMDIIRDIIQKLFYQERLTFKNLERAIQTDERMSNTQRRRAMNRLSFAERWISDNRQYEWADVLQEGSLNIFDLRMQAMEASEALKLCLIITDLVRRAKNGVNKMVVFDEAHEYVDCKELVGELENSITQIRHDGLSFVLASQFPERIPERIFKYLLTRLIFKLPNAKAINYVRHAAPNLESLSPQKVSNLDLEQGVCFIQTDDDCTDTLMRVPQALEVRPRCTMHGGSTIRQTEASDSKAITEVADAEAEPEFEELEAELCPACGEELVLKRSRSGPMMVCTTYPKCKYTRRA
jgi:hypothetical protein